MVRECIEEVGLEPVEYRYVATISCNNIALEQLAIVHVYLCEAWAGTLIETAAMKPYWFDIEQIPYENMMDNDKAWLPQVLAGDIIRAYFELNENYEMIEPPIIEKIEDKPKQLC